MCDTKLAIQLMTALHSLDDAPVTHYAIMIIHKITIHNVTFIELYDYYYRVGVFTRLSSDKTIYHLKSLCRTWLLFERHLLSRVNKQLSSAAQIFVISHFSSL